MNITLRDEFVCLTFWVPKFDLAIFAAIATAPLARKRTSRPGIALELEDSNFLSPSDGAVSARRYVPRMPTAD